MFGLFKSRKSPIRQVLEQSLGVRHTWFEWSLENDVFEPVLVVEYDYELDPRHPDFTQEGLDDIRKIVGATDQPHPKVRLVPVRSSD